MYLPPLDWYRSYNSNNSIEFHTRHDSALTALTVVSKANPPLLGYYLMVLKLTSLTEVNKSSCNILCGIYHLLHADHQCPCQACLYLACPVIVTRCTDILKGFLKRLCPLTTDRCPTNNNPPPTIRMLRINVKAFLTAEKAMLPEVKGCRSGSPQSFFCRCLFRTF